MCYFFLESSWLFVLPRLHSWRSYVCGLWHLHWNRNKFFLPPYENRCRLISLEMLPLKRRNAIEFFVSGRERVYAFNTLPLVQFRCIVSNCLIHSVASPRKITGCSGYLHRSIFVQCANFCGNVKRWLVLSGPVLHVGQLS